tara:strand:+ start:151 stop:504 length:354 start_codon:yes stop_codon:yes gene_type:complete
LEDSKVNPEENSTNESDLNANKDIKNEENSQKFTEFLEETDNKKNSDQKVNTNNNDQKNSVEKSIFKRILNDGFDGISTNPNYKMLALLIILLINLSLFFVIGNVGKAFLRNAGIMG